MRASKSKKRIAKMSVDATVLVLCFVLAIAPKAIATPKLQMIVQQPGIYEAETIRSAFAMSSAGAVHGVRDIKLVKETTAIPASKGIRFGFRYMVVGAANGSVIELKLVTKFPAIGLLKPASGLRLLRSEYVARLHVGDLAYREFQLDEDWEVVPGRWIFEFWHGDRKIGEQDFCLYDPNGSSSHLGNDVNGCPAFTS